MDSKNKRYYCGCGKGYAFKSGIKRHRKLTGCGSEIVVDISVDTGEAVSEINRLQKLLDETKKILSLKMKQISQANQKLKDTNTVLSHKTALLKEKTCTIKQLEKQLEHKDNQIQNLHDELKNLIQDRSQLSINNGTINITTNKIRQLLTEHSTGPVLGKITDMSLVFNEDDELFFDDIAYDHRQKILHKTLGDSIVNIYRTTDPKDQAVWNTDCSRLNYLIKHAIGKKQSGWIIDKKGLRVVEQIISPVLDHLKKKMHGYAPQKRDSRTLQTRGDMLSIIKEINDGTLAEKINRYIAGHLYMTDTAKKAITYESNT